MRRIGLLAVIALFTLIGGCGSGGYGGGSGTPLTAKISVDTDATAPMGFSFKSPVTVASGTIVTWHNESTSPHSIVWDSVSPASSPGPGANLGAFSAGADSATWTAPMVVASTTYNYHCGIHGSTMAGQVIVTPPAAGAGPY